MPLHQQVDQARVAAPNNVALRARLEIALLNINALRVTTATLSSAIVLWMLTRTLLIRDSKRELAT